MRPVTKAPQNLKGKTALLRVDWNVERPSDALRITASLPTIRLLRSRGARIVILSHRGRPKGFSRKESLRTMLPSVKKMLGAPVTFLPHFRFKELRRTISQSSPRSLFLLENLRFLPGESKNSPALARSLASLGDIYVNEAFSVSHRTNASIVTLARLRTSYAGIRLMEEISILSRVMRSARHPLVVVLGGAKASDKIRVLRFFLPRAETVLVGGATANTFLAARGFPLGNSQFEPETVPRAKKLLHEKNLMLPDDFLEDGGRLLDIGPGTVERFTQAIRRARTIVWNGPMGYFEDPRFRGGSEAIARAIAQSHAFSVAGGGETADLLALLNLTKRIGFLSTGGGAMLAFLGGEKLPGIAALSNHTERA